MSGGFHALNIEYDDESDTEVDDTKEIQIEEALRLYQVALNLHAEGVASYDQAAKAYRELFESEIFKYPESQTELQRIELYGPTPEYELPLDGPVPGRVTANNSFDTGPSTLPQILHLAHKNYAQFKLDSLSARFDSFKVTLNQILVDARSALTHFVNSLDKDDTDLDLWRRTASVGQILDSKRVARFCLESVLETDDEALGSVLSSPGLETGFAAEQLRELVGQLQDQLSILQAPLSVSKRRALSQILKQKLHPYSKVIRVSDTLRQQDGRIIKLAEKERRLLPAPRTWAELGDVLLRQQMEEKQETSSTGPSSAIAFDVVGAQALPQPPSQQVPERPSSPRVIIPRVRLLKQTVYPETLAQQFPGMGDGRPTVQPQIASADPSMDPPSPSPIEAELVHSPTVALPSRKRSGDVAGIQDTEEGRTKSKRIRARDSTVDLAGDRQAVDDANERWEKEQKLLEIQAADDWMFETVGNFFERIGIVGFDASRHVRQEMQSTNGEDHQLPHSPQHATVALRHARDDIQGLMDQWNESKAQLLLHGGENLDISQSQNLLSTANILDSGSISKTLTKVDALPNEQLQHLLDAVNSSWSDAADVAWMFIEALLRPGMFSDHENSYTRYQWPEPVKMVAVRILVNFDETLFERATLELRRCQNNVDSSAASVPHDMPELIQSIFELHLDVYSLIKQSDSGVGRDTIITQGDRLQRWSDLSREAMIIQSNTPDFAAVKDNLSVRFLWASTFAISASADVTQEHAIECMHDLRRLLIAADEPVIQLQNNAIMPEVSVDALDRELSKLTTKDFFLRVTSQDGSDPAAVIESLEPLLESLDTTRSPSVDRMSDGDEAPPANVPLDLVRFLAASPISVRLMLWQRLRDAYVKIEYNPMVVCCYLRMVGVVLEEIKTSEIVALDPSERLITILKSLRLISEWVKRLFDIFQKGKDSLQCMDDDYIKFAVSNFGELLQLLQVINVAYDPMRVRLPGASMPLAQNGMPLQSFKSVLKLSHETQTRIWIMLYALLQEAMSQNPDVFPSLTEDRFEFLRVVHRNLGIREICSCLNRTFVRLLRDEFFSMTHVEGYDSEQAQVLYDLYGLKCFLNPDYELIEHECIRDAFIDRGVALQTVDLLLAQASKLTIKDLVKHPLKDAIERIHSALSRKRPSEGILRNREIIQKFLKSHIQPLDLFSCLKGEGNHLAVTQVPEGDAVLASKGWFFLMGHMSLTKFRTQKRTGPTPIEDVDIAIAFFMQDLEFTMDHWETWFRIAQAYDTKIEEIVVWSAEKLNNSMQDVVVLQKYAIHCFAMATALAYRSADIGQETCNKMTELYHDFALRLYASSREPFSMKAFAIDDENIFISNHTGVHKSTSYQAVRVYTVWKLASVLFKRALNGRPDQWQIHYMVGKCVWKMHNADERTRGRDTPPTAAQVVEPFVKALELLPEKDKKESKDSKREPTLEPHYKLVSIVDKLWRKKTLDRASLKEAIEHSHYARKESFPEDPTDWRPYLLAVLKSLRTADKSNWYHRIIAKHAQIVYDEDASSEEVNLHEPNASALAAKEVLTAQMFTKTMVLQVWRPENERAGRHFVYTARYTRFIVNIFKQLKDRAGLEMLARRVRRRPHDLFEHGNVWQDICTAYLYLMRTHADLSEGLETACFSNIAHEEFIARKGPLESWMQETPTGSSPALDVLREVQELKKINQGLMKPGAIDDLIGDSYAQLFSTIGKQLWEAEERQRREEEAHRLADATPAVTSPARNPTMSLSHLMNVDGAADVASVSAPAAASAEPDLAPVRRKVGVGRREIRTAAEACLLKAAANPTKDKATANNSLGFPVVVPKSTTAVQTLIEEDRRSSLPGGTSVDISAPGSVHDDADDESELSDLEEEQLDDGEGKHGDLEPLHRSSSLPEMMDEDQVAGEDEEEGANDVEMEDEVN